MLAILTALVMASPAGVPDLQVYNEPVPRLKRERAALEQARSEVQAQIDELTGAIRGDPTGFYKSHAADCEVKGPKRADGSFDYTYVPSRAWVAKRKRLVQEIKDKSIELVAAYDAALLQLSGVEERLRLRLGAWKTAVQRLENVGDELQAQQAEWRNATLIAGCELVNESIPLLQEGMGKLGTRLIRPPKGSLFADVSLEKRKALQNAVERLATLSGVAAHAGKAYLAEGEARSEKDVSESHRSLIDAATETAELIGEISKEVVRSTNPAQLEEFKQAYGAVLAFSKLVKFGSGLAANGHMDEKTRIDLSEASVALVKFAGEFNPLVLTASMIYGTGAAAAEEGILGYTWWQVWGDARGNQKNLARARAMLEGVQKELVTVETKITAYRAERAELAAGLDR